MERLEITDVVSDAQLGLDNITSAVKVALKVTVAGQTEPVLLLMTEETTQVLAHTLNHGHRPTPGREAPDGRH